MVRHSVARPRSWVFPCVFCHGSSPFILLSLRILPPWGRPSGLCGVVLQKGPKGVQPFLCRGPAQVVDGLDLYFVVLDPVDVQGGLRPDHKDVAEGLLLPDIGGGLVVDLMALAMVPSRLGYWR